MACPHGCVEAVKGNKKWEIFYYRAKNYFSEKEKGAAWKSSQRSRKSSLW